MSRFKVSSSVVRTRGTGILRVPTSTKPSEAQSIVGPSQGLRWLRWCFIVFVCGGLGWLYFEEIHPSLAPARVSLRAPSLGIRGVSLGLYASHDEYDYGHFIDELVRTGATDLLVVFAWFQEDHQAHRMGPVLHRSPSQKTLIRTLRQAKARGLRVSLMPTVRLRKRTSAHWRGRISPRAGAAAWFRSYRKYLRMVAKIAQQEGVVRLSIGSELLSMERHTLHWNRLIGEIRLLFGGRLFYSANWDHFSGIQFWNELDEIGISAYFSLSGERTPSEEALRQGWKSPMAQLQAFSQALRKPLFFSEVGYPSLSSAARKPWDETQDTSLDLLLQARLYRVFCDVSSAHSFLRGFFMWNWFGFGGPSDRSFTPRGKPAQKELERCFRRWRSADTRRM